MCGITNSSYPVLKTDTDDQTTIHAMMAGEPIKISEILTNSDREAAAAFDKDQNELPQ